MIRIFCANCNSALKVPEDPAVTRGKCPACGAINEIPTPLAVEVKRAPEPSPFRSTADVAARGAIEGAVDVPGAQFLATAPTAAAITADSNDFELILPGIAQDLALPADPGETPPPVVQSNSWPDDRRPIPPPDLMVSAPPMIHVRPNEGRDAAGWNPAIRTALLIGLVLGFLLGILAARCMG